MVDPTQNPEQPATPEKAQSEEKPALPDLDKKIAELELQLKEKDNKYLYLYADFENFKKRSIKERSDLLKFGWESIARELLLVLDNLERALDHAPDGTDKNWLKGIEMVLSHLRESLEKQGIHPVQAIDKPFDPNFHEAVGQEPSNQPAGTILKEHSRGYTLHGRLLRPARVIVSGGQPQKDS